MIALLTAYIPLLLGGHAPIRAARPAAVVPPDSASPLARLIPARVVVHPERGEIVIDLPPVALPFGMADHGDGHVHGEQPPVGLAVLPVSGSLYGFRAEIIDSLNRVLPAELIHHINVIDPDHRELFLPISRRLMAAGRETGAMALPWLFFGVPFDSGQRLIISAMLHNPLDRAVPSARVRVVLRYTPEQRPWPIFPGAPFQLDVAFPVGDKSFDLPPGRSERSYEASPSVAGTIVGIGGHMHEYGVSIELVNATTGELIYRAEPERDADGRMRSIPVGRLYGLTRLGAKVLPSDRYRVTVVYENPTNDTLPAGGMGVVGGLFVPDEVEQWPGIDMSNELYVRDLLHATRQPASDVVVMRMGMHGVGGQGSAGARSRPRTGGKRGEGGGGGGTPHEH